MLPRVPCWRAALSPSGSFEAVPATVVQQAMRHWFKRWGRPQQIQFDHGQPWCTSNRDATHQRLPSLFELWLVGLGIDVVWSRPHHPQDNGIVERSHRTTQAWSAPEQCHSLEQLQQRLDHCAVVHRQRYVGKDHLTRVQRHPHLNQVLRPYHPHHEPQLWQLQRVYDYLATGCWQRKVDASGRISLYNHNYTVSRAHAKQLLWVRFDPATGQWCCFDETGTLVHRFAALEINPHTIRNLQLHRSTAQSHSPAPSPGKT